MDDQLKGERHAALDAIFLSSYRPAWGDVRMGFLNAAYMKLVEVIRVLQAADEEFWEGDPGE